MRKQLRFGWVLISSLLFIVLAQEDNSITVMIGASSGVEFVREAAEAYMAEHPGTKVEVVEGPSRTDDLLAIYDGYLNSGEGVDVLTLDVIWPGDLSDFMLDLYQFEGFEEAASEHFPAIIENNTTLNGELLAIPWFTDVGLLYYRTDLLDKYGFDSPPETWAELEEMALTIQEGERSESSNEAFWGYVFQGAEYEGLTVDALEWFASSGGGTFISSEGTVTANNPNAVEMLDEVSSWINTISPPGVIGFGEEESRSLWQLGKAAFMRNWPYAFSLGNDPESPIAGKFDVAPLPAGEGGETAAGLGGWGLGIPSYSDNPELAADFALFVSSREQQKQRAIEGSFAPTYPDLYEDADVLAAQPFFADLKASVENAVARPSAVVAPNYNAATQAIYRAVHSALTGENTPEEALEILAADLEAITGLPAGLP